MRALVILSCLVCSLFFQNSLKAGVIFDSLNTFNSGQSNITSLVWRAQQFTTGSNAAGYYLNSVVMSMQANTGATTSDLVAQIFNDSSNLPGTSVKSLSYTPGDISIGSLSNVNFSGDNFLLSANSSYWVVLGSSNASSNFAWSYTDDNISPYSSLNAVSSNGSTVWTPDPASPYRMIVNATAVPEPGTLALGAIALASSGMGTWWRRRRKATADLQA